MQCSVTCDAGLTAREGRQSGIGKRSKVSEGMLCFYCFLLLRRQLYNAASSKNKLSRRNNLSDAAGER